MAPLVKTIYNKRAFSNTYSRLQKGLFRFTVILKVCDNNQDCAGGEDECQSCSTDFFASDAFLISSYALQVLIWIVGEYWTVKTFWKNYYIYNFHFINILVF